MYMIEAKNVTKRFDDLVVFENININVKKGEVLVIIGPSGSGKSTFLRCLNHLEEVDSGTIIIEGEKIMHNEDKVSIQGTHKIIYPKIKRDASFFPQIVIIKLTDQNSVNGYCKFFDDKEIIEFSVIGTSGYKFDYTINIQILEGTCQSSSLTANYPTNSTTDVKLKKE